MGFECLLTNISVQYLNKEVDSARVFISLKARTGLTKPCHPVKERLDKE